MSMDTTNNICDGTILVQDADHNELVCMKGEDWADCDWCHGLCETNETVALIHHNFWKNGYEMNCTSRCGKTIDCVSFPKCSLNRELE